MDRRRFLECCVLAPALALVAARGAAAAEPAVFTGLVAGTGAGGYDVVAYFAEDRAVPGDPAITATHEGVAYRFASTENRALFEADPQGYLPQFGGYCAWAVANGAIAKGEPEAWTVTDDKLYLNYSRNVRQTWREHLPDVIGQGEANWPGVLE